MVIKLFPIGTSSPTSRDPDHGGWISSSPYSVIRAAHGIFSNHSPVPWLKMAIHRFSIGSSDSPRDPPKKGTFGLNARAFGVFKSQPLRDG